VSTATTVELGRVEFRAVIVGTEDDAARIERNLTTSLAAASGVVPIVAVRAVTPGEAIASRAAATREPESPPSLAAMTARFGRAVDARWPAQVAGNILSRQVSIDRDGHLRLRVVHWGAPPGAVAEGMLEAALASEFHVAVDVTTVSLAREPVTAAPAGAAAWWPDAVALIERTRDLPEVSVCASIPAAAVLARHRGAREVAAALRRVLADRDPARTRVTAGAGWSLQVTDGACQSPVPAARR
jgi:hypothetical protein